MKTATTVNATFTLPTSFPGIVDMGGESVEVLKKEYLSMIERSLEIEVTAEWRNGERIKPKDKEGETWDCNHCRVTHESNMASGHIDRYGQTCQQCLNDNIE